MTDKPFLLTPQSSVAELLERCPQVIPIFLKNRMSCVGCNMASFETLEDAARIYGVNLEQFMQELTRLINIC